MSEPTAIRRGLIRAVRTPIIVPISSASAKPVIARVMVVARELQNRPPVSMSPNACRVSTGPGRTYSGRQPDHTTICQAPSTMAMASNLGQLQAQSLLRKVSFFGSGRTSTTGVNASVLIYAAWCSRSVR